MEHIGNIDLKRVRFLNAKDRVTQLAMNVALENGMFYNKCPEYLRSFCTKTRYVRYHYTRRSCYNFQIPNINYMRSTTFYYNVSKE